MLVAGSEALVGRADELAAIRRLAVDAHPCGSSLFIRGAPGLGKSALLEVVADELSERGWRVLRTRGVPSERHLPFAGLQRLLRPIMGQASRLFLSQRVALLRAFDAVMAQHGDDAGTAELRTVSGHGGDLEPGSTTESSLRD